jgi:hypothetical protein
MAKKRQMTKAEALAYQKRWQRINAAERDELRKASIELKFRQLAALMASVDAFGWRQALARGQGEVRERWKRLRSHYGV